MAADDETNPRVYLFKDDYDMIQELVRFHPTRNTGGDLFGLWTNDGEPVLHIVTGQGIETVSSPQQVFSSNNTSFDSRIEDLGDELYRKFHLIRLGKWQYMPRSGQTEIATVGQKRLPEKAGMEDFLLILASYDGQSSKVELNPYFLSQFSTTKRGEMADALPRRSIFREDDDIANIVNSLIERGSFREDDVNREGLATKQRVGGNGKETEALNQRESHGNQTSDKIHQERQSCSDLAIPDFYRFETGSACNLRELKVYLFEEDYEMMKELVLRYPNVETGGDLFGLWTNDGEPVLHIVTGQGIETVSSPQQVFSSNNTSFDSRIEDLGDELYRKFHLIRLGKWQYMPRSGQTEIATVGQKRLPEKAGMEDFLLILASYDGQSSKVELNPYFLSQFSTTKRGEMADALPRRSIFREDDDIANIVNSLIERGSFREDDVNREGLATKQRVGGNGKETEALNQRESHGNQTSDKIHQERQSCSDLAIPDFYRFETGFACNPRELKVYLFEEDYEMMKDLVLRYPNVETGGDLFGLWTSDGDAVLHMVLGPGENCKRTVTSFYQDIPYLQEKGELLTTKYMLCHIGEWHSHHQLHLYEPSHGDSSTVIRHYPHGTCGFLLIIANILTDDVRLSPYLYTARSQYDSYQEGKLVLLHSQNAFKRDAEIAQTISRGREKRSHFQSGMTQYSHHSRLPPIPRTSSQFNASIISKGRGQYSNFQRGMAQNPPHHGFPQITETSFQFTESRRESNNDINDEPMDQS